MGTTPPDQLGQDRQRQRSWWDKENKVREAKRRQLRVFEASASATGIQRGRARSTSKGKVVEEKELLTRRRRLIGSRLDLPQRMGLRNLKTWEGLPDYSWEDPPLNTSAIHFAWS